nr:hypothetical protein [Tanacetum cinerariifolium]
MAVGGVAADQLEGDTDLVGELGGELVGEQAGELVRELAGERVGLFGSTSKSLWSENRWLGLSEWGFFSSLGFPVIGKSFFIPFVVLAVKVLGRV